MTFSKEQKKKFKDTMKKKLEKEGVNNEWSIVTGKLIK